MCGPNETFATKTRPISFAGNIQHSAFLVLRKAWITWIHPGGFQFDLSVGDHHEWCLQALLGPGVRWEVGGHPRARRRHRLGAWGGRWVWCWWHVGSCPGLWKSQLWRWTGNCHSWKAYSSIINSCMMRIVYLQIVSFNSNPLWKLIVDKCSQKYCKALMHCSLGLS